MIHKYDIEGMQCSGCKANVENTLLQLDEITKVEANLSDSTVDVEMTEHLSVKQLQETLLKAGLHYTISLPGEKKN